MCILMVAYRRVQGYPVVLAANRDEYFDRPALGPGILQRTPIIWGGRDGRAGGTWLGVNAHGLVVGLTNRRIGPRRDHDPTRRSRGLLCLEVLQCRTAAEVREQLSSEPLNRYNPFNLLVVDRDEIFWTAYEGRPRTQRLPSGLHILASGNLNDFDTVRLRRARYLLQRSMLPGLPELFPYLESVCRDHEAGVQAHETICMHRPHTNYGTVSSTILALTPTLQGSVYQYADGPPCLTPFKDYSYLFSMP